jgi:hypothetical protein
MWVVRRWLGIVLKASTAMATLARPGGENIPVVRATIKPGIHSKAV